jgi:predicted nucleic acid-binding protein
VTTHLAETSVLTRLSVAAVRSALQPFIDAVALARCTLTDLELGFSAPSATDWDKLQSVLTSLTPVEVTPAVISRAKNVQRLLTAGGLKARKVPDLIIAAAAELADLTVLHYDHDFELIASVTSQPHEWIVPRGSIDLRQKYRDGALLGLLSCDSGASFPTLLRPEDLVHYLSGPPEVTRVKRRDSTGP